MDTHLNATVEVINLNTLMRSDKIGQIGITQIDHRHFDTS